MKNCFIFNYRKRVRASLLHNLHGHISAKLLVKTRIPEQTISTGKDYGHTYVMLHNYLSNLGAIGIVSFFVNTDELSIVHL